MSHSPIITENDLVMCRQSSGKLVGGGFELRGLISEGGAVQTNNNSVNQQKGGSAVISSLKGLAVPAGLLFLQKSMQDRYYEFNDKDTVVEKSLFDKLYSQAADDDSVSSGSSNGSSKGRSKKKTRRNKTTSRKKHSTRKQKNK